MNARRMEQRRHERIQIGLAGLGATALVGALIGVLWTPPPPEPSVRAVLLLDVSRTMVDGCDDAAAMVTDLLRRHPGEAASLTLLATGGASTGHAPAEAATLAYVPPARRAHGVSRDDGAGELLGALSAWCGGLPVRDESPIADGVAFALTNFDGAGCERAEVSCELLLRSDGLEEVRRDLVAALASGEPLAEPFLPNVDVDVRVCGLGRRKNLGRRQAPQVANVMSAWGSAFTAPDHVTFHDHCP